MIRISAFLFSYEDTSKAYLLFLYEFMRLLGYVLECAGVSGTANGQLNDQAARLTGRSVDSSFISHDRISPILFCSYLIYYTGKALFLSIPISFHLTGGRFLTIIGLELFVNTVFVLKDRAGSGALTYRRTASAAVFLCAFCFCASVPADPPKM